jgi:ABC-type anion transport system duplicated permease subunit
VVSYVRTGVDLHEVGDVLVLGLITLLRVAVLIAISSMIWVPLGVMIGLRPALAEKMQPLAPVDEFEVLVVSGLVVGVNAGLLFLRLVVYLGWLISLSLLATVRGGTSFLCPKRQRNEAKKTLSTTLP